MTFTDQIPEQIKKPTYAVVGAGDAVVERIRGLDVDPKHLQDQAREFPTKAQVKATEAQARATERFGTVADDVKHLPEKLRALPERAQAAALQAVEQAESVYADLAQRGEGVVLRIRKQEDAGASEMDPATAKKTAKSPTTKAKTSASSKKSVSPAKKSTSASS